MGFKYEYSCRNLASDYFFNIIDAKSSLPIFPFRDFCRNFEFQKINVTSCMLIYVVSRKYVLLAR